MTAHPLFSSSNSPSKPSTLLHLLFICLHPSIHCIIHPFLGWQWCRAEKPWIIHHAGLFFPARLPAFGLPWRWKAFGQRMQSITCAASSIVQHMHVCRAVCNSVEVKYKLQAAGRWSQSSKWAVSTILKRLFALVLDVLVRARMCLQV